MTRKEVAEEMFGPAPDFLLSDLQAVWLSAFIDGEGTIGIWRERRQGNKSGYRYKAVVTVSNTNFDILSQMKKFVDGCVNVHSTGRKKRQKVCYRLTVKQRAVGLLLQQIRDFLIIKRRQADIVLQFCRALEQAPVRTSEDHEIFEQLYLECKALNKRGIE